MAKDSASLLVGPQVRRVERGLIRLFAITAYDINLSLTVELLTDVKPTKKSVRLEGQLTQETYRIAEKLFIQIITFYLSEKNRILDNAQYSYFLSSKDSIEVNNSLISAQKKLAYFPYSFPTFISPFGMTGKKSYKICYASCRNINASQADSVCILEKIVAEGCRTGLSRPRLLILGGDQIYSDGIKRHIRKFLTSLEQFFSSSEGMQKNPANTKIFKKDHLQTFPQWVAMYLLSWSPATIKMAIDTTASSEVTALYSDASCWERIFANTVSYMIFDDHDVTDDWFIDKDWSKNLTKDDSSAMQDAFAAYWFFQGCGNVIDGYKKDLLSELASFYLTGVPTRPNLLIHQFAKNGFGFIIPSHYAIVVFDCRTTRDNANQKEWVAEYALDGIQRSPSTALQTHIISKLQLSELLNEVANGDAIENGLITVMATPFFGWRGIETVQNLTKGFLKYFTDDENWESFPGAWVRFASDFIYPLSKRHGISNWINFSGDVHYSFFADGFLQFSDNTKVKCFQITSSAIRNINPISSLVPEDLRLSHIRAVWKTGELLHSTSVLPDLKVTRDLIIKLKAKFMQEAIIKSWKLRSSGISRITSIPNFVSLEIKENGYVARTHTISGEDELFDRWNT